MGILQQFGRSLMLPMMALPAAAISLRLGNLPWEQLGIPQVGELLLLAGESIFIFLPYIFAVGVALGLTESAGMASVAALLGYFLFDTITDYFLGSSFHLGVTSGIIIGVIAALAFHRFKNTQLPEYIQFFGGPRFVPLFMSIATIILSSIVIWIGPYVQNLIGVFSDFILNTGGFGAFVYGFFHRILVPSGLHHILNNVMWFQIGTYELPDGQLINGDLPRFFTGDPTAGIYMAGLYPIMMFALPAVAVAIILEAREDLKGKIRITFLTAGLASFLTGVTEPIEFAFLFVAPMLFFVHALFAGLAMWITYALEIRHGFSYSAGAIDFIINGHLAQNGWLIIPIGLLYGTLYYFLFRWAIRKFQIPTPGREDSPLDERVGDIKYKAPLVLQALGGKDNIIHIEACITRLRLTLVNDREMDIASLKNLGAVGVIRLGGGNVQIVFGTFSELIREEIMKVLRTNLRQVHFHSPVQGSVLPLEDVPDPVFSAHIVGQGIAFIPERGELVSPVNGKVIHIHEKMHAIGIETAEGLEVLLHIGIDTSSLETGLFQAVVSEGEEVKAGQLLIRFELQTLRKLAKSLATPMLITNPEIVRTWNFAPFKTVKKGQASVMSVVLKEEQLDGSKAKV